MDEVGPGPSSCTETIVDGSNRSEGDTHMYSVSGYVGLTSPLLQDDVTAATQPTSKALPRFVGQATRGLRPRSVISQGHFDRY